MVVWDEDVRVRVHDIARQRCVQLPPVELKERRPRHYFTKLSGDEKGLSVVTGPKQTTDMLHAARLAIQTQAPPAGPRRFSGIAALLQALRADFGCVAPTAELIGLQPERSANGLTVAQHTITVVQTLAAMDDFAHLNSHARDLVELGAFLHDIGNGPKARWRWNKSMQRADPDHAVRALPTLAELFTTQVERVDETDLKLLLKLVCYHDLVGDILGRGRDEQQLTDVVDNVDELAMLFALGRADVLALEYVAWDEAAVSALYNRSHAAVTARTTGGR